MQEQTAIEKEELKVPTTLKALIEALIFAAQEPLSVNQIRAVYQGETNRNNELKQLEPETIRQLVADLNKEYEKGGRPYRIIQIAGGYQFATLSAYAEWLGRLYKEQGRRKLSQSGVETLAIAAYKQPITKAEIEKIRGVNCDYVLKTLLEKELLTVTGRAESVGRPLLYGTTKEFLKHFGLNDITDLPRPREIEEILGESQFETERRMLEAQEGAEKMKKEQEDFKSRLPHIPKKKAGLGDKEVEIIPGTKVREIKIVSSPERKEPEETEQEKIIFGGETPIEQERHDEFNIHENEREEVKNILPTETKEEKSVLHGSQAADVSPEPGRTAKAGDADTDTFSARENGKIHSEPHEQQKPKRWKVWKEKIQGFIKKLFV